MCISKSFAREKKFCSGVEKKISSDLFMGGQCFHYNVTTSRARAATLPKKKMFILLRWLMNSLNFCINRRSPFFCYKAIEMEFDLWSSFRNKNRSMPTEKYVSFAAAAATEKLNLLLSFVFFPWSYDEVQSGKATEEKPSSFELSTR